MSARNEDFLFAQEALQLGFVTEKQVEEGFLLQKRMAEELRLDERLAVILVKRGWMGEEQARRVGARIEPSGAQEEIAGYRLVEAIGRGAMGTVYKAVHLGLHRVVAIKVLRKDLAGDPTQVERLKSEAKILASLDHPNIVRALDAGESNGFPFVVMEYVEGESLRDRIAREGPLPEEDALRITRGLADALERARRMGVVHRDVKPGNVLLTKDGQPKLMDLGLAKGPIDLGLTQHGATVGTPQYISPEQAQDPKKADTRSDIYSLGGTLYAMLTGRPPFEGSTLAEILKKVLYETPMPPRVLNREVSPESAYLIERMMLKDPSLRYRTPADVVRAIDRIRGGASIVPRGFTGSWEGYLLRMRTRRAAKVGGLTVALGVLVGLAIALWFNHTRDAEAQQRGEQVAEEALAASDPRSADDEPTLRAKHERVREALRYLGNLEVEKKQMLRQREQALKRAVEDLSHWNATLKPELEGLLKVGHYDQALARVQEFQTRVPGVDSAADVRAQEYIGTITAESADALTKVLRSLRETPSGTWAEFLEAHREHAEKLRAGFVPTAEVGRALDDADAARKVLEDLRVAVGRMENDFDRAKIEGRAAKFDLEDLTREFAERREALKGRARERWDALKLDWLAAPYVVNLLDERLRAVHDDIERTVATALNDALRGFERDAKGRDLAVAEEVPGRIVKVAQALYNAGFQRLANQAWEQREQIESELKATGDDADATYRTLFDDLTRYLVEGRPPEDLRRQIDKAAARASTWPDKYRLRIEELRVIPEGLEGLYDDALDGLAERRAVSNVRVRSGPPEKRWDVQDVHHAEHAATVVVTKDGRKGAPQKRSLGELTMQQVEELARVARPELPPLRAAVALLGQHHEREAIDLRPVVLENRRVLEAWGAVGKGSDLYAFLEEKHAVVSRAQGRREDAAYGHLDRADSNVRTKHYEDAFEELQKLLAEDSPPHWTDFFDKKQNEQKIRDLYALVTAQLFNVKLQVHFPGAAISGKGVVTTLLYDFETALQLQIFRKDPGRGWVVLERYGRTVPVTPEQTTSERAHILRGLEDDITRDRPLSLPSPFDPALDIVVEFDLYTLKSPSFFAVDVDGLQVGILSLDPTAPGYAARFDFPDDVPLRERGEKPPTVDFYGRGRGVAFHAGSDFGDPSAWSWHADSDGRHHEEWAEERANRNTKKEKEVPGHLFAFEAKDTPYRVKVVRSGGRLTLHVDGKEILSEEKPGWDDKGRTSDRSKSIREGTGRIQLLSWTPQAIDNLSISGVILERYR